MWEIWLVFRITLFPCLKVEHCLTWPIYTSDLEICLFLLKAWYWSFHGIFKIQLPTLRKKSLLSSQDVSTQINKQTEKTRGWIQAMPRMLWNGNGAIFHLQTGMGFLRTSVTACSIDKNTFSAPFAIFYVKTEVWKEIFKKKSYTTP